MASEDVARPRVLMMFTLPCGHQKAWDPYCGRPIPDKCEECGKSAKHLGKEMLRTHGNKQ